MDSDRWTEEEERVYYDNDYVYHHNDEVTDYHHDYYAGDYDYPTVNYNHFFAYDYYHSTIDYHYDWSHNLNDLADYYDEQQFAENYNNYCTLHHNRRLGNSHHHDLIVRLPSGGYKVINNYSPWRTVHPNDNFL